MGRSWVKDRANGREYLEAESNGLRSKGNEGGHLDDALVDVPLGTVPRLCEARPLGQRKDWLAPGCRGTLVGGEIPSPCYERIT